MKLCEAIEHPECPAWLKKPNIQVYNEHIEIKKGIVHFKGRFLNGSFENGYFGGVFDGDNFRGHFKFGQFNGGTFKEGVFEKNANFRNGIFEEGYFHGQFNGGHFNGGYFYGKLKMGNFNNGFINVIGCRWRVYYNPNEKTVMIGCETKTITEWDEWFAGNEEYSTPRNTKKFQRIQNTYEIAKLSIQQWIKNEIN